MTGLSADAVVMALAHLGDRLECAAAAGIDAAELDPLIAELNRLVRSFDPDGLSQGQRTTVAGVSAQVTRILSLLSDRHVQDAAQDLAAQSRDTRIRHAYGVGR